MRMQVACDATANATGTGMGACGSTICSASSCIGARVVLVCTRRCLGVFAHLGFRLRLLEHHDFASCKFPTYHETHDAMSDSCAQRNLRPGRSSVHHGVEQAADAEGHACRERSLFASRGSTARVRPWCEARGRDLCLLASTRRRDGVWGGWGAALEGNLGPRLRPAKAGFLLSVPCAQLLTKVPRECAADLRALGHPPSPPPTGAHIIHSVIIE